VTSQRRSVDHAGDRRRRQEPVHVRQRGPRAADNVQGRAGTGASSRPISATIRGRSPGGSTPPRTGQPQRSADVRRL